MENVGTIIKNARKRNGKTQAEVAEYLGISAAAVSRYESGARTPDYEITCQLAAYLHIPFELLMSDELKSWFDAGMAAGEDSVLASSPLTKEELLLSLDEEYILDRFSELNTQGQKEAMKRIDEMTRLEEYTGQEYRTQKECD